jgi:uncharacterized protein YggE
MDEHSITLRPPVWALLTAVIIGGLFYIGGKKVERDISQPPATISVTGEGKVTAVPDIAAVTLGMQTKRMDSADSAKQQLEKVMDAVFKAVKALGVEEKDISVQYLSLNPIYDWTQTGQIFRGFEASQSLRVKVRKLDTISDVVSVATKAGANQVGGVEFTIDDPKALQAQAREKAIADAKGQAEKLADQLGVRLDDIISFSEGGGYYPPMPYARMDAMGMTGGGGDMVKESIPLPAGEQEITVNVTMTYSIDD